MTMREFAKLAIGCNHGIEATIEQRVGNAGLLLHAGRQRDEGRAGRAHIQDQVRFEREHDLEIGGVAAPGDRPNLRPAADVRQQEFAFLGTVGARPAEQESGRQRIEQDRGRRARRKHTRDALRDRNGTAGSVGDGRRTRYSRRGERGGQASNYGAAGE
jgi:hypothetical protein